MLASISRISAPHPLELELARRVKEVIDTREALDEVINRLAVFVLESSSGPRRRSVRVMTLVSGKDFDLQPGRGWKDFSPRGSNLHGPAAIIYLVLKKFGTDVRIKPQAHRSCPPRFHLYARL